MLYKLDELMEGSAFEAEYDKAIEEGLPHIEAVERASQTTEEMTDQKVLRYAIIYKNYMAEAEALKLEAGKLNQRAIVKQNKAEALKGRLQMLLPPDFKLDAPQAVVSFRKSPASCVIEDISALPFTFTRVVPESVVPDKDTILKALKLSQIVPGAKLAPEKHNVQIK